MNTIKRKREARIAKAANKEVMDAIIETTQPVVESPVPAPAPVKVEAPAPPPPSKPKPVVLAPTPKATSAKPTTRQKVKKKS